MIAIHVIRQTNARLWHAIDCARIDRNPATTCEVRDAINQRRNQRAPLAPSVVAAIRAESQRQIRAWGRVENFAALTKAGVMAERGAQ